MEPLSKAIFQGRTALALVMVWFGGLGLLNLELFRHDYDEANTSPWHRPLLRARCLFRDFFYHQPSYFLHLLSWLPEPQPQSLWLYRLPALLGSWLTGFVLYEIAREGLRLRLAILAPVLFYASLLLTPGMQALPHGLMIFTTALGFYLIFVRGGRKHIVVGAALMASGVCLKPLAIAPVFACACALLILPKYRIHFSVIA